MPVSRRRRKTRTSAARRAARGRRATRRRRPRLTPVQIVYVFFAIALVGGLFLMVVPRGRGTPPPAATPVGTLLPLITVVPTTPTREGLATPTAPPASPTPQPEATSNAPP